MNQSRVMVVDDAVVVRMLVGAVVTEDPALQLVGSFRDGESALAELERLRPDVVIADIEMQGISGLELLSQVRRVAPDVAVIIFSGHTSPGSAAAIESLFRGAADYLVKPQVSGGMVAAQEALRRELLPRIHAALKDREPASPRPAAPLALVRTPPAPAVSVGSATSPPRVNTSVVTPTPSGRRGGVDLVVIGASTGGPKALRDLFDCLPSCFETPVLIVQHMPALFTRLMAERLNARSHLEVREAEEGAVVRPRQVWIAPGGMHLRVGRRGPEVTLHLGDDAPVNSCRPSVDVLFRSTAEVMGSRVLGVMLTGMGRDGVEGCRSIRQSGGDVIIQDEASSVVWGMPGAVSAAGLQAGTFPLAELGREIVERTSGRSAWRSARAGA